MLFTLEFLNLHYFHTQLLSGNISYHFHFSMSRILAIVFIIPSVACPVDRLIQLFTVQPANKRHGFLFASNPTSIITKTIVNDLKLNFPS